MKPRPCHIAWQEPDDFDRYPWPRKGARWLAEMLVEDGAGKTLLTLYRGDSGPVDFRTVERGAFDPYKVKRWAVIRPPYRDE